MRKLLIALVMVLTLGGMLFADLKDSDLWKGMDTIQKCYLLRGMNDMATFYRLFIGLCNEHGEDYVSNDVAFIVEQMQPRGELTYSQAADLMDKFYDDPANKNMSLVFAFFEVLGIEWSLPY